MTELISKALLVAVVVLAGVLLFGPYEAFLEGLIARVIVVTVVVGFLMYPRREVFYVRTTIGLFKEPWPKPHPCPSSCVVREIGKLMGAGSQVTAKVVNQARVQVTM